MELYTLDINIEKRLLYILKKQLQFYKSNIRLVLKANSHTQSGLKMQKWHNIKNEKCMFAQYSGAKINVQNKISSIH